MAVGSRGFSIRMSIYYLEQRMHESGVGVPHLMAFSTAFASTFRPPSIKPFINPKPPPQSAPTVMALSAVLRRAASAAAPLAVRALTGRQSHYCDVLRPLRSGSIARRGRPSVSFAHFSTPAAKVVDSDADLVELVNSEIKATEEDHLNQVKAIREEFPFVIHDDQRSDIITLKRSYKNETIEVEVFIPNLDDDYSDDDDEEEEEEKSGAEETEDDESGVEENEDETRLQLNITISKGDGPSLEFSCTANQDELSIDDMYFKGKKNQEDVDIADDGPGFSALDEHLQEAFYKFLERRGITTSTIRFLHEYMVNKERHGYLMWLNEVKNFIEK